MLFDEEQSLLTPDLDADGTCNWMDLCPFDASVSASASDRDGDHWGDSCDNCPDLKNLTQADADADGLGDACDDNDDRDGLPDAVDPCPAFTNTLPVPDGSAGWPLLGANGDRNRDGVPNECQCGDPNANGSHESDDLLRVFLCLGTDPQAKRSPCRDWIRSGDSNNSGAYESADLLNVYATLIGELPSWSLRCPNRPIGSDPLAEEP